MNDKLNKLKDLFQDFDIKVNIKQAMQNALIVSALGAGISPFVRLPADTLLYLAFAFGLFGGSISDVISFVRNTKANIGENQ